MAEKKTTAKDKDAETPKEAVKAADPPEEAESFSVERLINEAGAFLNQPSHVVAGALHGVDRKNLTLDEAEAAVDAWLKQPDSTSKEA